MKLILDVDTGTDDAVAIMMAALNPSLDLIACTTVRGNLPVEETTGNTLAVLDHIGATGIPVYRGLDRAFTPLHTPALSTRGVTGTQRMHPVSLGLDAPTSREQSATAVEFLVETLRSTTEQITLVPVAPLTNIAAAVTCDPKIVDAVAEVVIMGGAHAFGNVTPAAEANIWHDPYAADVVFQAGFERLVLVPLDATHQALIDQAQADELAALGTPAAEAASRFISHRIAVHDESQPQPIPHSAAVHDALCIAYLLDPEVLDLEHLHVGIETTGQRTFGRTVVDVRRRGAEAPNAFVATSADRQRFFELMRDSMKPAA
ncbi:nucleoside hydrolase [Agromyces aerolatus]|uniref:nucleoside hydrolase n=1 Tax=Agromyces sp. LY-1074 TaxID=3074080 RepID=UPI00285F75BE|nr:MULTISPECIES: nucleoside hydrolase [unclassified Agromyces]MDR5700438.1 nucleoside hydrolase [Agromyces sp. LY-1074]MDR5706959.1 nucleoside hydrolase [Agromyces sp. LY-1358]